MKRSKLSTFGTHYLHHSGLSRLDYLCEDSALAVYPITLDTVMVTLSKDGELKNLITARRMDVFKPGYVVNDVRPWYGL